MEVYFNHEIRQKIIQEIKSACKSLKIAVAWLSDKEIFNLLCEKASQIPVQLIIMNDKMNNCAGIPFHDLIKQGGELFFAPVSQPVRLMHNKFCIIDSKEVLTGSYNWTNGARYNDENLLIFQNAEIVERFQDQFKTLSNKYGPKVANYELEKNTTTDSFATDTIFKSDRINELEQKILPVDIGIEFENEPFHCIVKSGESIPVKNRAVNANTTVKNQGQFSIKIKVRYEEGIIKEIINFPLRFSSPIRYGIGHKANVILNIDETGALVVIALEMNGNNKNGSKKNLLECL